MKSIDGPTMEAAKLEASRYMKYPPRESDALDFHRGQIAHFGIDLWLRALSSAIADWHRKDWARRLEAEKAKKGGRIRRFFTFGGGWGA